MPNPGCGMESQARICGKYYSIDPPAKLLKLDCCALLAIPFLFIISHCEEGRRSNLDLSGIFARASIVTRFSTMFFNKRISMRIRQGGTGFDPVVLQDRFRRVGIINWGDFIQYIFHDF